jgi:uncharacterized membrane protein YadS
MLLLLPLLLLLLRMPMLQQQLLKHAHAAAIIYSVLLGMYITEQALSPRPQHQ